MDYTQVPRALIYEDRRSLEDFDAYEEGSITRPFLDELLKFGSDSYPYIKDNALWCMNNAFYICTMILLEKDPRPHIFQYKKIATPKDLKDRFISDKYWSAVLSMVILLLQRLETPLTKFQDEARQNLLGLIDKNTNNDCVKTFNCFSKRVKDDTSISQKIPNSLFTPRGIDKETVIDVINDDDFDWDVFTEEWRERRLREIVKTFGTTEEEKHNVVEILRQVSQDYYEDTDDVDDILDNIDNEIKLQINPDGKKASKETLVNEKQFDPTTYKDRIKELEEENERLNELTKNLQKQLNDTNTIPESITAQQRVRMELARLLMEKAGIDKTILDKWGNKDKAGSIMSIILDIPPTTCKTYLSDPTINKGYHKETILSINTLLEALELDFRL